jgi:hypothetical protein
MNEIPQIQPVRDGLLKVGFREDRLCNDVPIPPEGRGTVPLLAFADRPFDARTASIAVLASQQFLEADVAAVRPLGAPIVFACLPNYYQVWTQSSTGPRFQSRLTPRELAGFFERHHDDLAPEAIYRAKVWGRLEHSFQLEFVDAGFLPLIEDEAGHKLTQLVEVVVADTKSRLGWTTISDEDGRWLLKATFWLLAGKILQDKRVRGFIGLNLTDVEEVYARLAKHYNSQTPRPVQLSNRKREDALIGAAKQIKAFGHCGLVSTEALVRLYESALIDRTVRQKLGTHSTPTWLVDYIVGKLRPWVEQDIAVEDRRVFEPACGHAGFLIAAMRLLSELLPSDWHQPRRTYLRERLHGLEIDSFALEIARLSLTLADVPNPNGWALTEADMFKGDLLERGVRDATIVLGNPPFESFPPGRTPDGCLTNKAAETFRRVVEHLPPGGMFGFVLPQTFLHAKQAADVRKLLLRDYEVGEIDLFADKVFRYGEPESTVLIGRRTGAGRRRATTIRYQRIREWQIEEFSNKYRPSSAVEVSQSSLSNSASYSLLVPDLHEIWEVLAGLPRLGSLADIGKGLEHKGKSDRTLPSGIVRESEVQLKGLTQGFAGWVENQFTHELPEPIWLNLNPDVIQSPRRGTTIGKPQVLLNYARVSRTAWRLKALIDEEGHPVTTDFLVVRPTLPALVLPVIWAILNSPVANAYAYCYSSKRHVLTGDICQMPVPDTAQQDFTKLKQAVNEYLVAAKTATAGTDLKSRPRKNGADKRQMQFSLAGVEFSEVETPGKEANQEALEFLHWRVDAEVLRLYHLPAPMERKLLDLFSGVRRRGVPFEQTEYFPKGFTDLERLDDLLAITVDWPKTNRRRAKLMDLEETSTLTTAEASELENLQRLADASVSLTKPAGTGEVDELIERLERR